jgi:hypothetical protein
MGGRSGVYRVLVGKPEGSRPLGRTRHRWEDNIKMDLKEIGWGCGLDLTQVGRWWDLVNAVMNFRVPEMRGISRLAVNLSLSRRSCSMELVYLWDLWKIYTVLMFFF